MILIGFNMFLSIVIMLLTRNQEFDLIIIVYRNLTLDAVKGLYTIYAAQRFMISVRLKLQASLRPSLGHC
mgnify:CR=1 FL=1